MRRWLLQGQAVKTAVAATLAWAVGTLVPGVTRPYFAPLAAILTVQVSVAASLKRAVQRTLGVVVGVLLALLLSHLVGLTAWGVGVLVLVSLTVGAWLRLGPTGAPQVAVSALLVLIVGALSGPAYAWQRAVETAIGAAVGVAVGALLVPPSDVPAARKSLQALATDLAECLDRMAGGGEGLAEARHLTRQAEAARAAIGRAEESLLYNVWAGRQRAELDQFRSAFAALEHTAIQVRGIARALHDRPAALDGPYRAHLPDVLRAAARVVEGFWREVEGRAAPGGLPALAAAARAVQDRALAAGPPSDWVRTGSLLADADRLVDDLCRPG